MEILSCQDVLLMDCIAFSQGRHERGHQVGERTILIDVRTIFFFRILHGKNCGELASLRVENSNTINVLDGEIDFLEDLGSLAACSKGIDRDGHAYTYGDKNYYGIYNHCFCHRQVNYK